MEVALAAADGIGRAVSPNPGVGAVVETVDGRRFVGHTQPPGGAHAEIMALRAVEAAGVDTAGATLASTLEPCNHVGRTGRCTEAILDAGITRVLVGLRDPDPLVAGTGIARLRHANVEVAEGVCADAVEEQLAFYLHHRRTGRPFVTLKLAASLDGRTAAPDRTSQWITSPAARADAHRLRAAHDAILVGAGTVRDDDPTLTVRHVDGPNPRRIVLGTVSESAKVRPCDEMSGPLPAILDRLGSEGVLSLLVEGGATIAASFHALDLVDSYVMYIAPALFGGDDALGLFRGPGASTIADVMRGTFRSVERIGPDLKIVMQRT